MVDKNRIERTLIIEDDDGLAGSLVRALSTLGLHARACATVQGALHMAAAWHPDLLIVDYALRDGTGAELLELLPGILPAMPRVIAMSGQASAEQAFRLAQLGALAYLSKPLSLQQLELHIRNAAEGGPDLRTVARRAVGVVPLKHVEEEIRSTMLQEAMTRARNNRRGAARLLQVSRQVLQHMLRKAPDLTVSSG